MAKEVVPKAWNLPVIGGRRYSAGFPGGDFISSIFALKIIYPMAPGAAGSGLDANNRAYKQYTGIEYRIRLGAIGGTFPYLWSVDGPSGMTVEAVSLPNGNVAYDLVWASPTAGSHSVTVEVTDAVGDTDDQAYTLVVGTAGHVFLDSSAVSSGTGTFASPFKDLTDLWDANAGTSIAWFRGGGPAYTTTGIPTDGGAGAEMRIEFNTADPTGNCVMWVAYPGDTRPVLDQGYVASPVPRFRLTGPRIYVDGFAMTNVYVMGFQLDRRSDYGAHMRDIVFDKASVFSEGSNQAFIMTSRPPDEVTPIQGGMIVSCEFSNVGHETIVNAIKTYYEYSCLIEGNEFHDMYAPIEIKESTQFTLRNNLAIENITGLVVGGDLADDHGANATRGDNCYNFFTCTATGSVPPEGAYKLSARSGGEGPGPIKSYRNTCTGRILIPVLESTQGPETFINNVVLNDEGDEDPIPYLTLGGSVDSARIDFQDNNLTGPFDDAKLNPTTGALSGDWAPYNYLRGHRLP